MNKFKWPEWRTRIIDTNFLNPQHKIQKMKEENLIIGNKLSDEIRSTQRQIDNWEASTKFADNKVIVISDASYSGNSVNVPADAFIVIKTISLAFLKNRLLDLQKQFAAL